MSRPQRRLGLRARTTVAFGVLALVLSSVTALGAFFLTRAQLLDERMDATERRAYVDARLVRGAVRSQTPSPADTLASNIGSEETVALARINGDWYSGSGGVGPEVIPDSLLNTVSGGSAARQVVDIDGDPYLAMGVPLGSVGAQYFELSPLADVERTLSSLARALALGALMIALLAGALGWSLSGRVLRPLRKLSDATTGIAGGELDRRLDSGGDPDLQQIEQSFNLMADTVQERIEREHRFTSDVTHELRSPVAAMLSAIAVSRRHIDDPAVVADALDHLQARTEAFHHLVEELLELSRTDSGVTRLELASLEPDRITHSVLDAMGMPDVPVKVVNGAPARVQADERRLAQMLTNLVDNAQRYGGGVVGVEISGDDEYVTIAVDDAGPGVPDHERSYVFQRFARGTSSEGDASGSGLGLSLVAEHARLHGGTARVEESDSGGARFVIELPAHGPPRMPAA